MKLLLLVCAGGALGAGARHLINVSFLRWFGPGFPWATLFVNIVGCFLMGLLAAYVVARTQSAPEARAFLATGILGGFTTFSAFALDVAQLVERGQSLAMVCYIAASVGLTLAAVFLGLSIGRLFIS